MNTVLAFYALKTASVLERKSAREEIGAWKENNSKRNQLGAYPVMSLPSGPKSANFGMPCTCRAVDNPLLLNTQHPQNSRQLAMLQRRISARVKLCAACTRGGAHQQQEERADNRR